MLWAGALLDQTPGRKYTTSLPFFELAPRGPWPRPATFTRMRHQWPDALKVALRAPLSAVSGGQGPLRLDDALREERDQLFECAERLGACAVVLPTPADLTPSPRSVDLLGAYLKDVPRDTERHLVWAPRGAWEPEHSHAVATDLGLVCAFDPIHGTRPAGPVVYAQLVAIGFQTSFSTATLQDVVETIEATPYSEAFVSIDSPRSFKQAEQLQELARAAAAEA